MPILRCSLSCVRNLFLFSTIRLWITMNPALRSSPSIEHFKLNLKKQHVRTTPLFPHFYSAFICSCQSYTYIRLSALNCQRFQYSFVV